MGENLLNGIPPLSPCKVANKKFFIIYLYSRISKIHWSEYSFKVWLCYLTRIDKFQEIALHKMCRKRFYPMEKQRITLQKFFCICQCWQHSLEKKKLHFCSFKFILCTIFLSGNKILSFHAGARFTQLPILQSVWLQCGNLRWLVYLSKQWNWSIINSPTSNLLLHANASSLFWTTLWIMWYGQQLKYIESFRQWFLF